MKAHKHDTIAFWECLLDTPEAACSLFNYQKADDKIYVCNFKKKIRSKILHIENSKSWAQTV